MILEALSSTPTSEEIEDLIALLRECVEAGASIGFLWPLAPEEARAYWQKVINDRGTGHRLILVARDYRNGPIIGSAQIAFESRANGRHRAEAQKVMVNPAHRRKGIAAAMMAELERAARARAVRLIFLDTSDGPGGARAFYERLGYTYVGGIPDYALDPDGHPAQNAIYYKRLAPSS
jgi:ribosomal protein S18 acetylase RimI-like enzyme